jgi:hypothetical protein
MQILMPCGRARDINMCCLGFSERIGAFAIEELGDRNLHQGQP